MKDHKTVMLCYYYPPFAGVACQRSEKFAKYLPLYDVYPAVVSVHPRHYGLKVHSSINVKPIAEAFHVCKFMPKSLAKLFYPLACLWYVFRNRNQFDTAYISGSPFHSFVLTLPLVKWLKIPTVIDFRDSWSINHGYDGRTASTLLEKAREVTFQAVERLAIRHASAVIFATRRLQNEYESIFPKWVEKYYTIHNGFDPEDTQSATPNRIYKETTMLLAGKFYIYTPEAVDNLMQALKERPDLRFVYVGEEHEIIAASASRYGVGDSVTSMPFQPQSEVLRLIAGSDIGLVTNGMKNGLGTKIFEYLAFGKPVIALVPEGSIIADEFKDACSVLTSFPPHSTSKINELIDEAAALIHAKPDIKLDAFNRRENARALAEILDHIKKSSK